MVKYPLLGLKVAVHYGCHFLRPSNKIQTDNPINPLSFDTLVEALGARSITYDDKMLCCGGSFDRAEKKELGFQMMKHKLERIKEAGADAIAVCCPECFQKFDLTQRELKKIDYEFDIPVFYYPELLAIALGIDPNSLKMKHLTDITSIFENIEEKRISNLEIQKNFNLDFLKECYKCSACSDDCPPARFSEFSPKTFIKRILDGEIDSCIEDPDIWACLDCYLCYELCPSKLGLVDVFTTLRNLAAERGLVTPGFKTEYKTFLKSGIVGKFSISQRKKLKLPIEQPDVGDLVQLLNDADEKTTEEKVN
jgi:heterodisulfide reductase subunit C